MKDMPTRGQRAKRSSQKDLEMRSSRVSLMRSQVKGDLGEGKEDLFQVVAGGAGLGGQFGYGAFAADLALIQQDEAVAKAGGIVDLVDGEEESSAGGGVLAEGGGDVAGLAEVEAFERFIDEEGGLTRQKADGEESAFALAFRECAEALGEEWAEVELVEDAGEKFGAAAQEAYGEVEDPVEGLSGPGADAIGHVVQEFMAGWERDGPVVVEQSAGIGGLYAGEAFEEGRLPRPVRTDEAEDLSGADLEADAGEGMDGTEAFGECLDLQHS
jgi:hypothetical protein